MTTPYKVKIIRAAQTFLNGLQPEDQQAVRVLIRTIAAAPEIGDPVRSLEEVYYQKTYWINRQRWPKGLRVTYRYNPDEFTVVVLDIGDHRTSASHPGQSIYPDER
jgi:mRNA-degrading endonuclease RelE of RelBE toxin-antitoxin system